MFVIMQYTHKIKTKLNLWAVKFVRRKIMNIVKEHFDSIHQMIKVIESRPNNDVMKYCDSSHSGDRDFTGSKSYEEAKRLFENGYTDVLEKIKIGMANNIKRNQIERRRRVTTGVVGYAPHVPNAILGLPNSMILTEAVPQKIKALSIVVGITENCATDAEEFIRSGIAALSVVNTLELQGYRVNLKVAFYCAECGDDRAFGTVSVKDYREHLDIQKLCFPLAHPSMFRRLGFRWLETCEGLKESSWAFGYGRQLSNKKEVSELFLNDNEFLINLAVTKKCNYDVDKIIELFKIN